MIIYSCNHQKQLLLLPFIKMANKNPPIENYFKTDRKESCTAQISVRIPPSLKAKLKNVDNWQELVRQALEEAVNLKSV